MLTHLLDTRTTALFQPDYASARAQFLSLINQVPRLLCCEAHALELSSPTQQSLFSDCAWIGSDGASRVLVLISATHGVEGFAGSAIQADFISLLGSAEWQLPDDTAVLIIHALNPWGMAWLRRCNQQGVDLNRNFVDFSQPLPSNDGYQQLAASLRADADTRAQAMQAFRQQHGQTALELAVSGGQYQDPLGPFYGGDAPTFANRLIHKLINQYTLGERRLAVVDLHTGLGPYGYGEVICDHAPDSAGAKTAHNWYGDSVTLPLAGTSSSVPKQGLLDFAWHRIMNDDSCFVTLEFGTYNVDQLFNSVLADHRLHAEGVLDWQAPQTRAIKQQIRHHFCPDDEQWRELVLVRARQVIRLALEGLNK